MSAIHVVGEEVYVYDDYNRKIVKAIITKIFRDETGRVWFNLKTKDGIEVKDVEISVLFSDFNECLQDALKYLKDTIIENSIVID